MLTRRKPIKKTPIKKASQGRKTANAKNKLRDTLDAVFSRYIRLKYSDKDGNCRCISCGRVLPWREIQNGHYMSRRYMSTRFAEDNCRPQCVACNIFNQGNIQMYRRGLIAQIGEKRVDIIEARARTETRKYSSFEYQQLIAYYQKEVAKIAKDKGLIL